MASFVTTINDNQYVGDSLSTINNNYANLNTQSNVVITNTNSVSGNVIQKGTTVSNVSNFVYGTVIDGSGNRSITNKWSDVYINPSKDPLRITFTNDNYIRKAFLQGKIYTRNVGMATTSFYRLARFSDNTSPTPLEVIDTAAFEGNADYSHGYNTIFQSFYLLQPNTTYNIGLQHWWPRIGAQDKGGIQINGWRTPFSNYYAVASRAWDTFMHDYAIWVNPGTNALVNQSQNMYGYFYAPADGDYKFSTQADNRVDWYVDGNLIVSSVVFRGSINTNTVYLTKGAHIMYGKTVNTTNNTTYVTNPAGWAGTISDSNGNILWNTRNLVTGAKGDSWGLNTGNTYKYIYANDATIGYSGTGVNIESYIKLTII